MLMSNSTHSSWLESKSAWICVRGSGVEVISSVSYHWEMALSIALTLAASISPIRWGGMKSLVSPLSKLSMWSSVHPNIFYSQLLSSPFFFDPSIDLTDLADFCFFLVLASGGVTLSISSKSVPTATFIKLLLAPCNSHTGHVSSKTVDVGVV